MTILHFHKLPDGTYNVFRDKVFLGNVYRDPDAWSYASWFVSGEKQRFSLGGAMGWTSKASGAATRKQAARALARRHMAQAAPREK